MPGFDFGNAAQSARDWVGLRADQENLAQSRWQNQELRNRAEEANQYNRDESQSQADMYARLRETNPELFTGIDRSVRSGGLAPDQMAATNPAPAATTPAATTPAATTPAATTPAAPATPAATTPAATTPAATTPAATTPAAQSRQSEAWHGVRRRLPDKSYEQMSRDDRILYNRYAREVDHFMVQPTEGRRNTITALERDLTNRGVFLPQRAAPARWSVQERGLSRPASELTAVQRTQYQNYNQALARFRASPSQRTYDAVISAQNALGTLLREPVAATPATNTPATPATSATPTSYGSVPEVNAAARGADEIARSGVIERLFPGTSVTSASRTPQHNAAVGGVTDSMHITDEALDIVPPPGVDHTAFAQQLSQQLGIPFTEIIPYDNGNHLHVGWGRNGGGTGTTQVASAQAGTPQVQGGSLNGFDIRGLLGDTDPTTDTHFTGQFQDASISQHDTREMGLQRAVINDDLRRAEVAAAHGRPDIARASFLTALQGQAAYVQAYHMQLYHAAQRNNMEAAATLLADMQGYPPGSVRFRPTDERRTRFVPQVRNDQGEWVDTSEVPTNKTELLASLGSFVGIAADAAQAETQRAIVTSLIENNVRLQIADMEHRDRILNAITNAQTTIYNGELQREIAAGRAEVYTDSANRQAYVVTRRIGPDGQIGIEFHVARDVEENLPSSNNEHQRTTVTRSQTVDGVGGLHAND